VVSCGSSAAVRGGSKKPNQTKVRRLCGAWVRETPLLPEYARRGLLRPAGVFSGTGEEIDPFLLAEAPNLTVSELA
jgi:hypothetical protein